MEGTPAADLGVKEGDILLQVGKTKVHEPEDVLDASFYITAGDTVPITVMRGNEKLTFDVQADFHPAAQNSSIATSADSKNQAMPLKLDSIVRRTP
jgi:S1-C subfamily serine protease